LKSFRKTKDLLCTENFYPAPTANHNVIPVTTCFASAVSEQEVSGGLVVRSCHSAMLLSWLRTQPLLGRLSEKTILCFF